MKKILELRGKTAVFIDWANVHGWQKSLKKKVDLKKLFAYLKSYEEIKDIRFYLEKIFKISVDRLGNRLLT